MDYQEAIETVQDIHDVAETRIKSGDARGVVYINPNRLADLKNAISAMQDLQQYEKIGTLEEVREAVKTVRRYKTQYLDDMKNPLEPLKISSALKSEIMKLELRKQSKPESISVLDYTIIAALQKVLYEVCGEEE